MLLLWIMIDFFGKSMPSHQTTDTHLPAKQWRKVFKSWKKRCVNDSSCHTIVICFFAYFLETLPKNFFRWMHKNIISDPFLLENMPQFLNGTWTHSSQKHFFKESLKCIKKPLICTKNGVFRQKLSLLLF